ncbi:MAG TPA: hypothetical protein VG142_11925 [Trebonia sp.]|jgi:hypothetical protein|nr:hypothetical protein [Trebonia sp.]
MIAAVKPAHTCPAWCQQEADAESGQLHLSEVHEVGELTISLYQYYDENAPEIGISDIHDQELLLTPDKAEKLAMTLLQFAAAGRQEGRRAA